MKFSDLEFKQHRIFSDGLQCEVSFPNGYGASVITGGIAYSSPGRAYEVAVLKGGSLCYSTPVTDDVIGHLDEKGVEKVLADIEALPQP